MKARLSLVVSSLIAATALAGCFEPIQGGGVVVVGDPGERLAALCRYGHHGGEACMDAEAVEQTESALPDSAGQGAAEAPPEIAPAPVPALDPASDAAIAAPATSTASPR